VTELWQAIRRGVAAPAYVAIGVIWLSAVLYVVTSNFILRETAAGTIAEQIDRLPPFLARSIMVLFWCLFFVGWIVPLFIGARRLFRRGV
jgi:hypothetical protein